MPARMQGRNRPDGPRCAVGAAVLAGVVGALGLAPATAAAKGPLAPGPYSADRVTYDAGELELTVRQEDGSRPGFSQPLEGSVTFPSEGGPWPVALFLHGRHATCIGADGEELIPDPDEGDVTCQRPILNYSGYDYISSHLASHGYAVIAPSANVIHSYDGDAADGGAAARAELIGATLDRLWSWNEDPGPAPVGASLTGRLDLGSIALMGHSRGGEGVTEFIFANARRPRTHSLGGVLALAPTDVARQSPFRAGTATNLAELLPACDGDVIDLEGGHVFERVKYDPDGAAVEKYQWVVEGTNHNWFNTVWRSDDAGGMSAALVDDSACSRRAPSSVRLDRGQQRVTGIALIASFVRRFAGGESGFGPLLRGRRWPRAACRPDGPPACAAARTTSFAGPLDARTTVIEPGGRRPAGRNELGGSIRPRRLTALGWCDPTGTGERQARRCPGPSEQGARLFVNRSETKQLVVTWDRRSKLETSLAGVGDASRHRDLVMRTIPTLSSRNPRARGNRVGRASQRFDVILEDADGQRDRVAAERFSSAALAPSVGDTFRNLILTELRVPLRRFEGVDLTRLRSLELRFGVRNRSRGQIQLSDLAFEGAATASRAGQPRGARR